MSPVAAFAIGVGVGVGVTALTLVSLAPNLARDAVIAVGRGVSGETGIPSVIGDAITVPIANQVRTLVARKVAPWAL